MYSPQREQQTNERVAASPLRAFTPIVDVIKTAQTNASRDFDRFYDNLWAKLTPKTTHSRFRNSIVSSQQQQQTNDEMASTTTSLTPLIERHSLREDARARYEYSGRNPFEVDCESDIGETPGLLERGLESPSSFISHNTSMSSIAPSITRYSPTRRTSTYKSSPRRSNLTFSSSLLNQRFEEERKQMDKLQESVSHIRRQSTLLAERSSRMASFLFEEEEEDDEEEDIELNKPQKDYTPITTTTTTTSRNINRQYTPLKHASSYPLATPPYSVEYNNKNKTPLNHNSYTPAKRIRSPSRYDSSPVNKRIATSPITKRTPPKNGKIISPKRIIIEDRAKLRSTEMITTPGGTMVSNRFWKEIHGLNATRSPHSTPSTPIQKRISTLQQKASSSQNWANDDQFWSSSSSPAPSSLNHKLLQVAQQEENQKKRERERTEDDMHWSSETPVTSSFAQNLFSPHRDDDDNQSVSSTPSLFKNKLFKAAQGEKKQLTEQRHTTFSEKVLQLAQHDATTSTPSKFNEKLLRLAQAEDLEEKRLSEELEAAKKRDDILKRNNIPKMNPLLLAELKAKHHNAKIIDDSDSYKFT